MAKPGPKGKTKEELRASGSWREPTEDQPDELENPQSGRASETPPTWLIKPEVVIWKKLVPKALEMKTFKDADHDTFALFCRSLHKLIEMQKRIEKHGDTIVVTYQVGSGSDKKLIDIDKESPLVRMERALQVSFNQYSNQFGFNPLARTRLKIVPYTKIPVPSAPVPDPKPNNEDRIDRMMGIKKTT